MKQSATKYTHLYHEYTLLLNFDWVLRVAMLPGVAVTCYADVTVLAGNNRDTAGVTQVLARNSAWLDTGAGFQRGARVDGGPCFSQA